MKVKFKKICENAKAPYHGTIGSAGFDLYATSKEQIDLYHTKFGTGLAVEIPVGYVGLVFPRSSCYKSGMLLTNCVGVIDSDYRGEITAVFLGTDKEVCYKVGDRICQLVIMPYPEIEYIEVSELSDTGRGAGGYGSTGR
jgi:dUTP pyrophosphatase